MIEIALFILLCTCSFAIMIFSIVYVYNAFLFTRKAKTHEEKFKKISNQIQHMNQNTNHWGAGWGSIESITDDLNVKKFIPNKMKKEVIQNAAK